jgi:hypothetical protein
MVAAILAAQNQDKTNAVMLKSKVSLKLAEKIYNQKH